MEAAFFSSSQGLTELGDDKAALVMSRMTKLLEKAFEQAAKLPEEDQDALAEMLLSDLSSEERWTEAFARSQDKLGQVAREARIEFEQGKTRLKDEDS